ncbi:hypothetical protein LAZ67_8002448 [Cordylochernes scorpioides]|uniref:Uncharacterized protein n=1 Tax=Cordylochernes scorpioides TaxID=51811 RepID=A0ABY6KRF3_9ARAC|nr:hypothetical protein LAZ67_8002448 [Cordylochernes scorpioides]
MILLRRTQTLYFVYSGCHKDTHKEYNSGTCLQLPRQKNLWCRGRPLVKRSVPHYSRPAWTTPYFSDCFYCKYTTCLHMVQAMIIMAMIILVGS